MLTDSGINAMNDNQLASMMVADDSYAGSATFTRLETKVNELFATRYFLPAHLWRHERARNGGHRRGLV